MLSYVSMEQVCERELSYEILFTVVCQLNQKLHLSEQDVVINFCKITEPRKTQMKIEIKRI